MSSSHRTPAGKRALARGPVPVLAMIAAAVVFVARAVVPYATELSYGFAAYYTSARLVVNNVDAVRLYDSRWFMEQAVSFGFGVVSDPFNVNPPTTSLMFLPIQWLSPIGADVAWTILNLAFLTLALLVLFQTLRAAGIVSWREDRRLLGGLSALALVFNPIYENFRYGQAYILLLLLTSLAMRSYVQGEDRQTGLWLGLLLLAKSSGVLLWIVPLLDRRLRAVGWGMLTVAGGVLVAAPLIGLRVWWEYLQLVPGLIDQRLTGVTAYQTMASLMHHLFKFDPIASPHPLLDAPELANVLSMVVAVAIAGAVSLVGWRLARERPERQLRLLRFALVSAVAVPLQPVGEEHHYVLLFPAVVVGLTLTRGWFAVGAVALGTLALAAPIPFKSDSLRDGWMALLAYPKLYGALLVAAALAGALMSSGEVRDDRSRGVARPLPGRAAG